MQAAYSPVHQTEADQVDPPPAYEHPPQVAITITHHRLPSSKRRSIFRCLASISTNLHLATDPNHCLNHQIRSISIIIVNIIMIIIMLIILNIGTFTVMPCYHSDPLQVVERGVRMPDITDISECVHFEVRPILCRKLIFYLGNVCTNQCTLWLFNCIEQWWIMIIALFSAS